MILYFLLYTVFTAGPNIKWDVLHALQFCTGRYSYVASCLQGLPTISDHARPAGGAPTSPSAARTLHRCPASSGQLSSAVVSRQRAPDGGQREVGSSESARQVNCHIAEATADATTGTAHATTTPSRPATSIMN